MSRFQNLKRNSLLPNLLHFYEQRIYVNKTEKRWTHGCITKQLGLLPKGRDMCLLTRKRSCINLVGTSQNIPPCDMGYSKSLLSVSHVSVPLVFPNPTMHCPWKATSFLSLRGNNFDIFFIRSDPNRKLCLTVWSLWTPKLLDIGSCNLVQKTTSQCIFFLFYHEFIVKL